MNIINNISELKISKSWKKICKIYPYNRDYDKNCYLLQLDGIIDESKWHKSPIKILYVLKESYRKGSIYDKGNNEYISNMPQKIIDWENNNELFKTYKQIDKWTKQISNSFGKEQISITSTAIINISKIGLFNESSTKSNTLKNSIEKIFAILIEQIQEINPDIIICGNTLPFLFSAYKKANIVTEKKYCDYKFKNRIGFINISKNREWQKQTDSNKYDKSALDLIIDNTNNYIILSAYHPMSYDTNIYKTTEEDFNNVIYNNIDLIKI